jgi:hypothetical protein
MEVRSLDFKKRDFASTEVGGILAPGEWFVASSIIGEFEIHRFKDRGGYFLFWRDNRRGEELSTFISAKARADWEYEQIVLGEIKE